MCLECMVVARLLGGCKCSPREKGGDVCKREEASQGDKCVGRQSHAHKAHMWRADNCMSSLRMRGISAVPSKPYKKCKKRLTGACFASHVSGREQTVKDAEREKYLRRQASNGAKQPRNGQCSSQVF